MVRRLSVVLVAIACVPLAARQNGAVPVDREPQHRTALLNDTLRVLDVWLPPSYESLWHRHANDNLSVRIMTGPLRLDVPDGPSSDQLAAVGRVAFNAGGYTHRVANVGTAPVRILDVELVRDAAGSTAPLAPLPPQHELVLENARVRVTRIRLSGASELPAHAHPTGWLQISVTGEEAAQFRWMHPGHQAPARVAGQAGHELVEIEIR